MRLTLAVSRSHSKPCLCRLCRCTLKRPMRCSARSTSSSAFATRTSRLSDMVPPHAAPSAPFPHACQGGIERDRGKITSGHALLQACEGPLSGPPFGPCTPKAGRLLRRCSQEKSLGARAHGRIGQGRTALAQDAPVPAQECVGPCPVLPEFDNGVADEGARLRDGLRVQ